MNDQIAVGNKAPFFKLEDDTSKIVASDDFIGKYLVLYFYPKDNTTGCTNEAIDFKSLFEDFTGLNTVIIGVSKDSVLSHKKFVEKYTLPFNLLADTEIAVSKLYGVWKEKKMYGKTHFGTERTTFIIDANSIIRAIFPKVKVSDHANQVLAKIKELQST